MNPFHEYLAGQLQDKLKRRSVVVFYDPRREFEPFIDELPSRPSDDAPLPQVSVGDTPAHLARFKGSFLGLRLEVEPLVACARPAPLLIYVPGQTRDPKASLLMELECAGEYYEPQLKRLARNVLRESYSDGQIDELLARENFTYEDAVSYISQSAEGLSASMLKTIFGRDTWADTLTAWLAGDDRDVAISEKEAAAELYQLIESRLGLPLPKDAGLSQARATTLRYLLVNEFRFDYAGAPPTSVSMIPETPTKDYAKRVRDLATELRRQRPDMYAVISDRVASELGLSGVGLESDKLGSINTFRFEEGLLLGRCAALIAARQYRQAAALINERSHSFWLDHFLERQAQWECCRLLAELGLQIETIRPTLGKMRRNPNDWVAAYCAVPDGWHQADQLHRKLEAWVANMEDDPEAAQGLGVVRREYEELLKRMAAGFAEAFRQSGWTVTDYLHQTQIYPQVVAPATGRVAYFFVDAMRYEMGVELAAQLREFPDLNLRPAVVALPSITEVGMAALLPGSSSSFSVVEQRGKLAARIEDAVMPGLAERLNFLKAKVPGSVEMRLDKVLSTSAAKLQKMIADGMLVVVRSQEIDKLGEQDHDLLARQSMDSVIGNIARAARKLAKAGVNSFVIAADHGHQFALRKGEDMRADSPGGQTVGLHRRCWAGHGGQTPPGSIRVSGADLGYDTDLDFIFPTGLSVYKAQGSLSFHHGSFSLQELLVPVVSFRAAERETGKSAMKVKLDGVPDSITNRTFGVRVLIQSNLFANEAVPLRITLLSGGEQVGQAGMVVNAELDRATGHVKASPGVEASVGMMLTRDDCQSVRIVVQEPTTDAVLAESKDLPVNLGI